MEGGGREERERERERERRKPLSSWRREREKGGRDHIPPDTTLVTVRQERKSSEDANYNIQPDVKCKLIYIGLEMCVRNFSGR